MLLNKNFAGFFGGKCWDTRYIDLFNRPEPEEDKDEEEVAEEIISNIKKKVRGY